MLTEEEKRFIAYWEFNRLKRRRFLKQLAIGLPLAVAIVIAIFINFISGWNKAAKEEMQNQTRTESDSTVILVLVIAALLIVVFTAVFSARHKWDMYEQKYRELLAKKDQP